MGEKNDHSCGYSPFQSELVNPAEQSEPCTLEGFRLRLTTGEEQEEGDNEEGQHEEKRQPWPDPTQQRR